MRDRAFSGEELQVHQVHLHHFTIFNHSFTIFQLTGPFGKIGKAVVDDPSWVTTYPSPWPCDPYLPWSPPWVVRPQAGGWLKYPGQRWGSSSQLRAWKVYLLRKYCLDLFGQVRKVSVVSGKSSKPPLFTVLDTLRHGEGLRFSRHMCQHGGNWSFDG